MRWIWHAMIWIVRSVRSLYIYIMIVVQNPSYMLGLHVVSLTCMVAPVGLAE